MALPLIAAALLAAGGVGLPLIGQNRAARRQEDAIRSGLQRQDQFQEQANAAVNERVTDFDAGQREENANAHGDAILDRLNASIAQTRTQGAGLLGAGAEGEVTGNAFKAAQGRATADQAQNAANVARLLSRVGGQQRLRQDEQIGGADLASQLGVIGGNAGQAAHTDQLRAQQAGRPGIGGAIAGGLLRAGGQVTAGFA